MTLVMRNTPPVATFHASAAKTDAIVPLNDGGHRWSPVRNDTIRNVIGSHPSTDQASTQP